jgi:hypothetical protein
MVASTARIARDMTRRAAVVRQPLLDRFEARLVGGRRLRRHREYAHETAELIAHSGERFPLLVGAQQQHLAVRIIENVSDVVAAVLRVERHDDQAQSQRGLVENHPLG